VASFNEVCLVYLVYLRPPLFTGSIGRDYFLDNDIIGQKRIQLSLAAGFGYGYNVNKAKEKWKYCLLEASYHILSRLTREKKGGINVISIILPTFNRAKIVSRSIRSVLNQTYKEFELIIIDDGSADCTQELISKIKDSRIRYIKHEKNKGAAAARNTGIKAAQYDLIAFQDSDDEWMPEKLEKQIKVMSSLPDDYGVVYSAFWRLGKRKKYIPDNDIIYTR